MVLVVTFKNLIFFIFIFILNSCSTINDLDDSFKSMCVSNPQKCNNIELCNSAVLSDQWENRSNYIPFVREAKKRGLSCGLSENLRNNSQSNNQNISNGNDCTSNASKCSNTELCEKATLDDKWEIRSYFKDHVSLAKQKDLTCGTTVNQSKNNIDNMLKYALKRLVQLNILSGYQIKNKEQIIEDMDKARFNSFYQLCKNAFANSEPVKCDNAIKRLN